MDDPTDAPSSEKSVSHTHGDAAVGKEHAILDACRWKNLDALRSLAESPGGFLTDRVRQQACKCSLTAFLFWDRKPLYKTRNDILVIPESLPLPLM